MKFEPGKYYKTRDGRKVRIYTTDAGGRHPIHGSVWNGDRWVQLSWATSGTYIRSGECGWDLISEWQEPKPREIVHEWMFLLDGDWVLSGVLTTNPLAMIARKTGRAFYADDGSPVPQDVLAKLEGK